MRKATEDILLIGIVLFVIVLAVVIFYFAEEA